MRLELDEALCAKYPKMLMDRHADKRTTAMCWGFECGDGWYNLLDALMHNIQSHIDWRARQRAYAIEQKSKKIPDEVPQVVLSQVKEKFGTLSFYYSGGDERIFGMVMLAETISGQTCEWCGNPGKPRNGGWIRTLCDKHEESHQRGEYDESA
jgi:hypothetical protein